jgi:hypothetical protein
VYDRLQKLVLSMSENSTYDLIHSLGQNHDSTVLQWKDSLIPDVNILEVSYNNTFVIHCNYSHKQSACDSCHLKISSVFKENENDENVDIEDDYIISSDDDEVHGTKEKDVSMCRI